MTVEAGKTRATLSVLRAALQADQPVDDLLDRLAAAGPGDKAQGDKAAVHLTMWRARDGVAARLQAGAEPAQALSDWRYQTELDLGALQRASAVALCPADPAPEAGVPTAHTLTALSQVFAAALLNSDPQARAQARVWDAGFDPQEGPELSLERIEQAHAELADVTRTATRTHMEAVLARAGRQADQRARTQAAGTARDREAVLARGLLDRSRGL